MLLDSEDIDKYVRQPNLFVYGHSLGSAVGTALTSHLNSMQRGAVSGLILDSPFTCLADASMSHPSSAIFRIFPIIKRMM